MQADLGMDWELVGDEFDEEYKLRAETQKILGLPDLPIQATCIRIPVLVGHGQAIWVETQEPLSPEQARSVLAGAQHIKLDQFPTPGSAAGRDEVLVGRIRQDSSQQGLALWAVNDNLRKGAALNAIQIAELILARSPVSV
jgi:aspartate-semialdehyde dehydrogenase